MFQDFPLASPRRSINEGSQQNQSNNNEDRNSQKANDDDYDDFKNEDNEDKKKDDHKNEEKDEKEESKKEAEKSYEEEKPNEAELPKYKSKEECDQQVKEALENYRISSYDLLTKQNNHVKIMRDKVHSGVNVPERNKLRKDLRDTIASNVETIINYKK